MEDLISSLSAFNSYVSDENVIRDISKTVSTYINNGYVVIVGRAGCVLAKHVKKSLHVRLHASLEWKTDSISRRFQISKDEARRRILENEHKRMKFMEYFRGNKPDSELFDITFNRGTLSNEDIVNTIYKIAKNKEIVLD